MWEAKPLRSVVDYVVSNVDKLSDDDELPVRLCNYTDVYNNEFITAKLDFMPATASAAEIEKFGMAVDDVIITKDSESRDDIGVPALVREIADRLVCGYHLAMLRPRKHKMKGAFLLRCLQARPVRAQIELAANGVTRFGVPKSEIGKVKLPVPPLTKQHAIIEYLDRETARLHALIATKGRVLDLLAEKRQALVTRAVTRGLESGSALRDSGIPWLEDIPVHWETRRLKSLSPQITVGIVVTPAKYYQAAGVPVLRSLNVRERGLSDAELVFISERSNVLHAKSILTAGDLVAVRSGQPGTTAVVDRRFDGANCIDLIIIRRADAFDSVFLALFLNSEPARMQFLSGSGGAVQQHFNIETAGGLLLPVPPLEEQHKIVAAISEATTKIDALCAATERTMTLLRERRAALIAAVVMGKIDVGEDA